ncbi:hypothetical protein [Paraburkholderia adhaesiva]|uniref:hypothetical protein n=1 Tax=Paraburkholderia adhaesiva TaxID=2883244 RepID=UPI001F206046|nr:hypothetical protein [Paraburkholderia adhaesiva]
MASTTGGLVFDIAANVASLRRDMQEAQNVMNDAFKSIKRAAKLAGVTIGTASPRVLN